MSYKLARQVDLEANTTLWCIFRPWYSLNVFSKDEKAIVSFNGDPV